MEVCKIISLPLNKKKFKNQVSISLSCIPEHIPVLTQLTGRHHQEFPGSSTNLPHLLIFTL